jgi:uncharacterized protein (DUF58 family)
MVYLLLFLILIGILLNELSKRYILDKVYFNRNFSKRVAEIAEDIYIEVVVENRKLIPVTFLQFIQELPSVIEYKFQVNKVRTKDFLYHTMTFFLLPYQRIKRKYLATCTKRGRYVFGNVELCGGDFLGLNLKTKSISLVQDLVVLPKRKDLEKDLIPYGNFNGDTSVKRWIIEDPTMIIGVKDYTGREPAKTIHWPLSLKHNKILVKNFDFTYENNAMIFLNVECSKPYWIKMDEKSIEECISVARSVGEIFHERKIPFGFTTNSLIYGFSRDENTVYPGMGDAHLQLFLEYLGRLSYNVNVPFEEVIKAFMRNNNFMISTYVIITPYLLREYIPYISALDTDLTKVILITYYDDNLSFLSPKILKYSLRREKNVASIS